jgi:hypothetical protein
MAMVQNCLSWIKRLVAQSTFVTLLNQQSQPGTLDFGSFEFHQLFTLNTKVRLHLFGEQTVSNATNDDLKKEISDLRQSVHELTKTVQELTQASSKQQNLAGDQDRRLNSVEHVLWGKDPLGVGVDANSLVGMARTTKFYLKLLAWVSCGGLTTFVGALVFIAKHVG